MEDGHLSGVSTASTTGHLLYHPDLLASYVKYTPSRHSFSNILLHHVAREIYKKRLAAQAIASTAAASPEAVSDTDHLLSFLSMLHSGHKTWNLSLSASPVTD